MVNERTFVVDNLVVNQGITSGVPGAALQFGSSSVPTIGANLGATLYSANNGTTGFIAAATAAIKVLDIYTIPAGTVAAKRGLRVTFWGTHAANGNTVTVYINLGGTGAVGATISGGTNVFSQISATSGGINYAQALILNQTTAAQTTLGLSQPGTTAWLVPALITSTIDMTAAQQISLCVNNATTATDSTWWGWFVELV